MFWGFSASYNVISSFSYLYMLLRILRPELIKTFPFCCYYSRTSMVRTLMARLPWLFRTHSWVPWKKSHSCRFEVQSTLVISKWKRPFETLRDIRTSTYQICWIEENTDRTTKFHKWTWNLTSLVRNICWKYCGKGRNFSSYPQYCYTWC